MTDFQVGYIMGAVFASQATYWTYRVFVCRGGGVLLAIGFPIALIVGYFNG